MCEEALAVGGQFDFLLLLPDQPLLPKAVEHLHAEIAREMVVANSRAAQCRILWPGANAHVTGARGEPRKPFEHAGDIGIAEAKITMAALFFRLDQTAGLQLGKMRAC